MKRAIAVVVLVLSSLPSPAVAQDEGDDGMASRHRFELGVSAGLSWISDAPDRFDLGLGGQLGARTMVDLIHVRGDASFLMPDPTRPDHMQLRADARLLFLVAHDFTWRRSDAGELIRLMAGLGGEIDLPADVGHLMMSVGFAMTRLGAIGGSDGQLQESYGAYAGLAARLHFWEIRDELRVAVHGMMPPPELALSLDFSVDSIFAELTAGVTASNRLYVQALREGPISLGPELLVQVEQLPSGFVVLSTLGVSGTLGI
ncbi:MAG TPA: hypothetical protein RMH99_20730 [Sandaracinaceae bacterium LLY-WYZ-13_1]|nr:hypothetical protein [Sandaracinaceae bacterium LLY-WYZ-13_1]